MTNEILKKSQTLHQKVVPNNESATVDSQNMEKSGKLDEIIKRSQKLRERR